jgi:hypothetical protein
MHTTINPLVAMDNFDANGGSVPTRRSRGAARSSHRGVCSTGVPEDWSGLQFNCWLTRRSGGSGTDRDTADAASDAAAEQHAGRCHTMAPDSVNSSPGDGRGNAAASRPVNHLLKPPRQAHPRGPQCGRGGAAKPSQNHGRPAARRPCTDEIAQRSAAGSMHITTRGSHIT